MNFNKCVRCGSFYTTSDCICPKCTPKDNYEMNKLKEYLEENTVKSVNDICSDTGITVKNINRYLENEEFTNLSDGLNNTSGDIGISL